MKKNPILIFTGLAVAAVAALVGVTRDRWMQPSPVTVAGVEISKSEEPAAQQGTAIAGKQTVVEQPAAMQEQTTIEKSATAVTQPAATATAGATPEQTTAGQAARPAAEPDKTAAATQPATAAAVESAASAGTEPQAAAAAQTATAAAPSFDTVRVEKTGEAVIAGRAEAGSEVTVKLDGQTIGTAVANEDGAFVVTPGSPLPAGSGALTIEAKKANETVALKSEQTVAVIVPADSRQVALVAVISPDAPTKILQKPAAEPEPAAASKAPETAAAVEPSPAAVKVAGAMPLSLDAVDYDATGNIVFSGRGTPGATARLYVDNAVAGNAKAGDDGRWTFAGSSPIATGKHTLRVDGLDTAGAVVGRVELPFFREEQEKVAIATAEQTVAQTTTTTTTGSGTATADAAKPKDGRIVIQPGNNLWRISRVIYGSGTKFTVIFEANKDHIRNPDLIYPGQVFMTPDVVPPENIDPTRRDPLKPEEGGTVGQ